MTLVDAARRLFRGSVPDDSTDADFLRCAADMGDHRVNGYNLYDRWYDGDHGTQLLDRAKLFLEGEGIPFSENFCETVVDWLANRLHVEAFEATDRPDVTEWINKKLWANRRAALELVVHTETVKLGDGALIGDWDNTLGLPVFRWNHPKRVKFVYADDGDQMLYAVKKWTTSARSESNSKGDRVWRMNVYFPDRTERWISSDKKGEYWDAYTDKDDLADDGKYGWPIWSTVDREPDGEPLGIPAFHFANKPLGRRYGKSELHGAIPYNRQLNKQALDLFAVMDTQGWKQRWAAGIGDTESLSVAIGEWVKATASDAKFGEFTAEDPRPLVATMEATVKRMSAKTATPFHELVSGDPPSGEMLKTSEGSGTKKAASRAISLGTVWSTVSRYGWRMGAAFGEGAPEFDPAVDITAKWDSFETRDERGEAETATLHHELGVSSKTILRNLGYDDPEGELEASAKERDATSLFPPKPPVDKPPPPPEPTT